MVGRPSRSYSHRLGGWIFATWLAVSVWCTSHAGWAADWTITPRVSLTEDFSDNINLAPTGERSSDFVTEVTPGVSIRANGGRIDLNFDYALQQLVYRHEHEQNTRNHQLQAGGQVELVKQVFFIEATASASQENASNRGRVATSNISIDENRNDVYTYSVTPVVRHHFGNYADAEIRYGFDSVKNSGSDDSRSNNVSGVVNSGRRFARLPWSISYDRRQIDNGSADDTRFESLEGTVDLVINRKLSLRFGAGREDNDFSSTGVGSAGSTGSTSGGNSQGSGNIWRASAIWRPTDRSNFELGYEDRFFGSDLFFNLSHRSRRTVWKASYSSELTTTRQLQLERQLFPLVDAFGDPILDPFTGEIVQVPVDTPTLSDQVFRQRRFDGSVTVQGRRTSTTLNVYDDRRDDPGTTSGATTATGGTERVFGLSNSWSRRLSPRTNATASASWQRTTRDADNSEDTLWSLGVGLGRNLGKNLTARLDYKHVRSAPETKEDRYTENRLSAGLQMEF